ncbi:A24 family peptidase [Campylobacter sp. RM16190]|uniref:prepilin peptidase n=1 Tax=Campylobacter sp. RM16190 TaxID=1705727 RepID=UPI0014763E2C|nr:A24 family peptidase [Campylobacter sp. RM16190]
MIGAIFFILGAVIGSFGNVLIYRMPKGESINFPASHCQSCKTPLKFYHNVPMLSWIFLGGKCGFCKDKISFQYPLVEFLSGILMLSAYFCETELHAAVIIGTCFIILLCLSVIDFRYKAVPDPLLFTSLILALIYGVLPIFGKNSDFDRLISAVIFMFAFWLLRFVVSIIMKREAMGSADIFIAGVMGAILGIKLGLMSIYMAALLTLPAYMIVRKRGYELPFVPFLSLGLLIVYLLKPQFLELLEKLYG